MGIFLQLLNITTMSKEDYDFFKKATSQDSERESIQVNAIEESLNSSLRPKKINLPPILNGNRKILFAFIYLVILSLELELYESIVVLKAFLRVEATLNPVKIFFNALFDNPLILILLIVLAYFISKLIQKKFFCKKKNTETEDARGFILDDANIAGSSRFMSAEEKRKLFTYLNPKRPEGNILGIDKDTKELITVPFETEKTEFTNRNIGLFGPPGMRKTSGVLLPQMFSNIQAGNSIVCTDPKGELYKETYAAAKYHGYKTRVFNVLGSQFKQSDGWDCLKIIRESDNPQTTATLFADILLQNCGATDKAFWGPANFNCLLMALLYVAKSPSFSPAVVRTDTGEIKGEGLANDMYEKQRTLKEVYALITDENLEGIISNALEVSKPENTFLIAPFNIWSTHSQKDSIRSGLGIALNILQVDEVSDILSRDEIDFNDLADEKTIFYIVCADNSDTYKSITTLFITFMFIEITKIADEQKGSTLKRPLFVILEEAGNIGHIPNLARYVSTVRSRNIGMLFCFQTIGQLIDIYGSAVDGRHEYEAILAGCSIQLCLGANDLTTQEYFSKRSGKMSAIAVREGENRNKIVPEAIQEVTVLEKNISSSATGRPTLFPDEVAKIKKNEILISPSAENVTIENKYYYKNHPLYNIYLEDTLTGEPVAEHLTKEHLPKWRADELRSYVKTEKGYSEEEREHLLRQLIADDERFIARVGERPALFEGNEDLDLDADQGSRSYSKFKRRN